MKGKLKWVLRYVLYATALWIVIGGTIVIRIDNKQKLFDQPKYSESCCKCWKKANDPSYTGPKLEFAHCIDDGCSCNLCNDQYEQFLLYYNYTETCVTCADLETYWNASIIPPEYDSHPAPDKGCYSHLSTSSFHLPIQKAYNFYGYLAIAICVYHILLLWLYFAMYKSINVGILFFIHSIVNAEICFYCLLKSYQFQPNEDDDCFESIIRTQTGVYIWQFVSYSIIFHVTLQYLFSCSRYLYLFGDKVHTSPLYTDRVSTNAEQEDGCIHILVSASVSLLLYA